MSRVTVAMAFALSACVGGTGRDAKLSPAPGAGTVASANFAPVLLSTDFKFRSGTDLHATLTATDPEDQTVTFARRSNPVFGEIVSFAANGEFVYRPDAGFSGIDRFTVFVCDGVTSVAANIALRVLDHTDAQAAVLPRDQHGGDHSDVVE